MTRDFKKNFLIDLAFILVAAFLIYFTFKFLMIYFFPFIIGLIITAIIQKPSGFISEKTGWKKGTCALILVILTYIVLIGALFFFGYQVVNFFTSVANNLPQILDYFEEMFASVNEKLSLLLNTLPESTRNGFSGVFENLISTVAGQVTSFVSSFAAGTASHAPGVLISVVVTIVASCYIAKDFDTVKDFALGFLSGKPRRILSKTKSIATTKIFKIIKGYLLIMLITFAELSVGLLLFGIDNAILIALLIAILDLLPVLGTGTVLIPWGLINIILGNYLIGAALIILYVVVLIVRNIIEPKIISKQVGLHPLITLLCIFIGLKLFGFIGIIFLPLITILIYNLYKEGELSLPNFKKA